MLLAPVDLQYGKKSRISPKHKRKKHFFYVFNESIKTCFYVFYLFNVFFIFCYVFFIFKCFFL